MNITSTYTLYEYNELMNYELMDSSNANSYKDTSFRIRTSRVDDRDYDSKLQAGIIILLC